MVIWEDVKHVVSVSYEDFINMEGNLAVFGELTDTDNCIDVINNRFYDSFKQKTIIGVFL